jgi:hypothetical protein
MKKAISLATIFLLLTTMYLQVFSPVYASNDPYITMDLDKTSVKLDDIITATVRINNISGLSGYQINIKYDPAVLKAVNPITGEEYRNSTAPLAGDLLENEDFNPNTNVSNNISKGVLNAAKSYYNIEGYKNSGIDENTGSIAIIGFKVIKEEDTNVVFEDSVTMPNGITGTLLFDRNGNRIESGYSVKQPPKILANVIPTEAPTKEPTVTPTKAPTATPTKEPTATPTKEPTATPTKVPTATPTEVKTPTPVPTSKSTDSYITIKLNDTKPVVGDVIKASIKINNIDNFSGYTANIKYDPSILQPVNYDTGAPFKEGSIAGDGDILVNDKYGPFEIASNKLSSGIINLNKSYLNLEKYRLDNKPEKTGVVGVIGFKVLREGNTTIRFENSSSMPNGISGTMLFDWYGNPITSGYTVIQPNSITAVKSTATDFEVDIGSDSGNYGDEVIIPVRFYNVPSRGITATDMTINYDSSKLEYIDGEAGSIVTNPKVNFGINKKTDGKIRILFLDYTMDNNGIKSNGIFVKLKFKIKTSSKTTATISMTNYTFGTNDLSSINATVSSGKVTMNSKSTTATPTPKKTASPTQTKSSGGTIQEPNNDIPAGAKTGVHKAYLKGYTDNCFRPKKEITRAEAAVIVAKFVTSGNSTTSTSKTAFSDVSNNHWAKGSIEIVTKAGLFQGYPDGSFKPDDTIKRGEFAAVVFKLLNLKESSRLSNNFTDIKNHWAKNYILELADLKYISGYSDGTFKPENKIKRDECVVMINRALGRGPLNGAKLSFEDVPESYWAYKDIAEGSLDHEYYINSNGEEVLIK